MNSGKKRRGLFAARAHSFKENLLDALKSQTGGTGRKTRPEKKSIVLAKKTSSTDNLTGHLGTAKTTDCLIKEVQFALKYFQDVVSKQTYEMLPGCATVVLETVLAIQAFAGSLCEPELDTELRGSLQTAFKAVSVLTQWADTVIVQGSLTADEDWLQEVIEPVRRAVIVAVNCIAGRLGQKTLGRGNSLPDITSDCGPAMDDPVAASQSSDSIVELGLAPPLFPKHDDRAPPLPPKHLKLKPKFDKSFESLVAHSAWLSGARPHSHFPTFEIHRPRQSLIRRTGLYNSHCLDQSLPFPQLDTTLDTTLPDTASQDEADETDCASQRLHSLSLAARPWPGRPDRSNTSSPSETVSFSSLLSDPPDPPPAIPRKARRPGRKLSQYDNIPDSDAIGRKLSQYDNMPERRGPGRDSPPPLPPKKRNITSYMEMFGRSVLPSGEELLQGFLRPHDLLHTVWQQNMHEYTEYAPSSLLSFPFLEAGEGGAALPPYTNLPPALPPKRSRPGSFRSSGSGSEERRIPIMVEDRRVSQHSDSSAGSTCSAELPRLAEITKISRLSSVEIPIQRLAGTPDPTQPFAGTVLDLLEVDDKLLVYGELANHNNNQKTGVGGRESGAGELRAGPLDALIVLATQTIKNDFLYQEAFLATYRTFLETEELVDKLVYRVQRFSEGGEGGQSGRALRASRASFSLLVRVVDGLADVDFQNRPLLEKLTGFITQLVERGELGLARALRSQFILKYEERRTRQLPEFDLAPLQPQSNLAKRPSLLNFKSVEVAEQMTLLDSHLFLRIDSAELLTWVQEQSEEKSVNLTKFTEHFNNMSYWARTLILQQPDNKVSEVQFGGECSAVQERERFVMKFIKIMKWLRKMNNFNSYLALLSALDSAPIRRLEWQKSITDGLTEYCSLIDSSSSFRAYRLALAESSPPCIPYIGLVLQDLTFVQIGNPDLLDGKINFAKRWQQFNILDNLSRFKKDQYQVDRKEDILIFFGEFSHYLSEDEMWTLSETIKPRGSSKKQ